MGKRKNITIALIILSLLILAACGGDDNHDPPQVDAAPLALADVLEIAHQQRLGIHKPDYNVLLEMTQGRQPLTWQQLESYGFVADYQAVFRSWVMSENIPVEVAISDFRRLFANLRYANGVDGSEILLPVLEAILEEIAIHEHTISRLHLNDIVNAHLPNILDRFFMAVTVEEATADIHEFFAILRHVYGGYLYFGGDEIFEPIKEQILAQIANFEQDIPINILEEILFSHLAEVIVDAHFSIGSRHFTRPVFFYYRPGLKYDRGEASFRNRDSGQYVAEVAGHDKNELFRLAVDADGDFFYTPILMLHEEKTVSMLTIIYKDGSESVPILRRHNTDFRPFQEVSLRFIEGVPVVTVMRMGFTGHDNSSGVECARAFLGFAPYLRDEAVVILDLRGNRGGNGILGQRWLYALTGEVVPTNYIILNAREFVPGQFQTDPNNNFHDLPREVHHIRYARAFEGYTLVSAHPDRLVPRDNGQKLIVLVDRGTGSAGEAMTDVMFNLENTLIIGQNTTGVLAFDLTYPQPNLHLPRSGIPFGLGRAMFLWPEGHFAEGVGIAPDVWAVGDALTAALAMLRN